MKNITKTVVVLCCVLAMALAFTACDPAQTPTAQPTAKPTEAEATATPEPEVNYFKEGDEYRILIWSNKEENQWVDGSGARGPQIRETWLNFQEEHGIKITYVVATGDWLGDTINAAVAGEPTTDIFHMGGPFAIPLVASAGGIGSGIYFADLAAYSDGADFSDPEYWDVEVQKSAGVYGGRHVIAIPREVRGDMVAFNQVCFYNIDLIEQGGHTAEEIVKLYNDGEWTFDKFREVAVDCTDLDKEIYGLSPAENCMAMVSMIAANGGDILKSDESGAPHFAADSAEALYAINYFVKMVVEDKCVRWDAQESAENEKVTWPLGKTAMCLTYVNRASDFANMNFGIVLPPKGPNATTYISDRNWFTPYCVFKDSPVAAGAVQLLATYLKPEFAYGSEDNILAMKADMQQNFKDQSSIDVLADVLKYDKPTPYMAFWSQQVDGNFIGELAIYRVRNWINGTSTPEVDYQASKLVIEDILTACLGLK